MITITIGRPPAGTDTAAVTRGLDRAPRTRATRLLAGEWGKLRSLPSTWWLLLGTVVSTVGIGFGLASTTTTIGDGPGALGPTEVSLAGHQLAQLLLAALGVLAVTAEFATGTARSTFTATPRRWPVVVAKLAVLTALVLPVAVGSSFAAFFAGQAALGADGVSVGDPGVARAVLGTGLYLAAIALLGAGLGWLLRHTAAALTAVTALVLVLPALGALLPSSWGPDVVQWLPSEAADNLVQVTEVAAGFGPWTGLAVLGGWVAASTAAGTLRLLRQDV